MSASLSAEVFFTAVFGWDGWDWLPYVAGSLIAQLDFCVSCIALKPTNQLIKNDQQSDKKLLFEKQSVEKE